MTSTNDGKDVKSNQTSGQKGKTFYIELYKSLEAKLSGEGDLRSRTEHLCEAWRRVHTLCQHSTTTTHPHLLSWLQKHTASTLLQTEWQSPKSKEEHTVLTEAINTFIEESKSAISSRDGTSHNWERQLIQRAEWFKKVLPNPWGHPVLRVLLDPRGKPPSDDEVLEWLKEERGVMFVTRLRQLAAAKCDDLALALAAAVMGRARAHTLAAPAAPAAPAADRAAEPECDDKVSTFAHILKAEAGFTTDVWELLTDIEFVLLHKLDQNSRCIELAKQTPLRSGYQLVERLRTRLETSPREKKLWKNAKDVATLITQVVIARCMVVPVCAGVSRAALYCCTRSLVRLLAPARLPPAAAALAAPAATARHLHTLAAAVDAQCKDSMKSFVCELYIRAITAGMNELEKLKLDIEKEPEARSAEQTLSTWFTQLGTLLSASARVDCECKLTAFSVHPSSIMYEKIKAAPELPPLVRDAQETKNESISEFGSWANDSRSQTNFVKTSEHLNLKQIQLQANVLSTAILTEGEALGLDAELCQDLAVLLSGPRVKTLSWDMDRELLLENCRNYMERTSSGTRAVTTELKYLNLDPSHFQHLPEEIDDENDIYYGIEKGYEHLVEFQEPEEVWQYTLDDPERTESACSSSMEDNIVVRRKKKKIRNPLSSDEDSDPLSLIADAKRGDKKKVRPHSKERSKEHRGKINPQSRSSSHSKDQSHERPKDISQNKEKKKERKQRKKKEKAERQQIEPKQVQPSSLSNLLGMKVQMPISAYPLEESKLKNTKAVRQNSESTKVSNIVVTDSDYDSQGKSSLSSMNSEGNDPNVLFDGLFSMDHYKSPERTTYVSTNIRTTDLLKDNELRIANGDVALNLTNQQEMKKPTILTNMRTHEQTKRSPDLSSVDMKQSIPALQLDVTKSVPERKEDVKKSITKLIQFRKKKSESLSSPDEPKVVTQNIQNMERQAFDHEIMRPNISSVLSQTVQNYSPKDITEAYANKNYQSAMLQQQTVQVKNCNVFQSNRSEQNRTVIRYSNKDSVYVNNRQNEGNISGKPTMSNHRSGTPSLSQNNITQSAPQINVNTKHINQYTNQMKSVLKTGNSNFEDFLMELQKTINAGAVSDAIINSQPKAAASSSIAMKKVETVTTPLCAKQLVPQKKAENALNTFSRLSYMHKNKQSDIKDKQAMDQSQSNLSSLEKVSMELDRQKSEYTKSKVKSLQSKVDLVMSRIGNSTQSTQSKDNSQKLIRNSSNLVNTSKIVDENPIIAKILQEHTPPIVKSTSPVNRIQNPSRTSLTPTPVRHISFTEKDENDLIALMKQKNKLAQNMMQPTKLKIENSEHMPCSSTSAVNTQQTKLQNNLSLHQINKSPIYLHPNIKSSDVSQKRVNSKPVIKVLNSRVTSPVNLNKEITKNVKHNDTCINMEESKKSAKSLNNKSSKDTNTAVQDWESVMSAILAQKTPSRGPNALEMALKNNSYQSCFLEHTFHSIRTCSSNVDDIKTDKEHSESKLPKSVCSNNNSVVNKLNIPNIQQLHNAPKESKRETVSKQHHSKAVPVIQNNEVDPETRTHISLQPTIRKSQPRVMVNKPLDTTTSQSSNKQKKNHAKSRAEKIKRHTDAKFQGVNNKPTQNVDTVSTNVLTLTKPIQTYASKKQNPNNAVTTSEVDSLKQIPNITVQRKQFTCELPNEDDPFISGILNSDYDLIEELMDDDLRQEIGELSSDEDSYGVLNQTLPSEIKNVTDIENITKTQILNAKPNISALPKNDESVKQTIISQNSKTAKTTGAIAIIPKGATDLNIIGNSNQHVTLRNNLVSTAKVIQHTPKTTLLPESYNSANIKINHNNIVTNNKLQTIDSSNTYITPVPQQNVQNVVVVGHDIVYSPYPAIIQDTAVSVAIRQCEMGNMTQKTYVAISNTPNITLHQSTQFAAPVVHPVIIGNALTASVPSMIASQRTLPIDTAVKPPNESHIIDTVKQKKTTNQVDIVQNDASPGNLELKHKVTVHEQISQEDVTVKSDEKVILDHNKNCESMVLSELQEKQKLVIQVKNDSKNMSSQIVPSLESDTKKDCSEDEERLKKKRMAILNREINHRCCYPPIPLFYFPLSNVKVTNETQQKPNSSDLDFDHGSELDNRKTNKLNREIEEINNLATPDSQEDVKENHSILQPQHQALSRVLRSSNKLRDKVTPTTEKLKNNVGRKTKVRLKVTDINNTMEKDNFKRRTRRNSGIAQTAQKKNKRKCHKILKVHKKQDFQCKTSDNEVTEFAKNNPNEVGNISNVPDFEFIDIEDALLSSKITKLKPNIIENDKQVKKTEDKQLQSKVQNNKPPNVEVSQDICKENKSVVISDDVSKIRKETESENDQSVNCSEKILMSYKQFQSDSQKVHSIETVVVDTKIHKDLRVRESESKQVLPTNSVHTKSETNINEIKEVSSNLLNSVPPILPSSDIMCSLSKNLMTEQIDNSSTLIHNKKCLENKPLSPEIVDLEQTNSEDTIITSHLDEHIESTSKSIPKESNCDERYICVQPKPMLNSIQTANNVINDKELMDKKVDAFKKQNQKHHTVSQKQENNSYLNTKEKTCSKKSTSVLESYKDKIIIEKVTSDPNDPLKKCVRIKLPDGKICKATVFGKLHVNVDTLFSDPSLRAILVGSLSDTKKYTLNIKQISTSNKGVATQIQGIEINNTPHLNNLETVNLVSDDEEEETTQIFKTEFGCYNMTHMDDDVFNKHQNKFSQKCSVQLQKLKDKPNCMDTVIDVSTNSKEKVDSNSDISNGDVNIDTVSKQGNLQPLHSELNISETPTEKSYENIENIPEIIEIDDSSNESLKLCLEKNSNYNLTTEKQQNPIPEMKIDELKNLLIQELGIENEMSTSRTCPNSIETHKDMLNNIETKGVNFDNCCLEISKCDDLVKKYEITKRKCFVKLFRCDYVLKPRIEIDDEILSSRTVDESGDQEDCIISTSAISCSGSFSTFNDQFSSCGGESIALSGTSSPAIEVGEIFALSGKTSPVIEVFDTIASLRHSSESYEETEHKKTSTLYRSTSPVMEICEMIAYLRNKSAMEENEVHQTVERIDQSCLLICESDWRTTKRMLHFQSQINNAVVDVSKMVKTTNETDYMGDEKYCFSKKLDTLCNGNNHTNSFESNVPTLLNIVIKFFENNLDACLSKMICKFAKKGSLASPTHKMKRKLNIAENTVLHKVPKMNKKRKHTEEYLQICTSRNENEIVICYNTQDRSNVINRTEVKVDTTNKLLSEKCTVEGTTILSLENIPVEVRDHNYTERHKNLETKNNCNKNPLLHNEIENSSIEDIEISHNLDNITNDIKPMQSDIVSMEQNIIVENVVETILNNDELVYVNNENCNIENLETTEVNDSLIKFEISNEIGRDKIITKNIDCVTELEVNKEINKESKNTEPDTVLNCDVKSKGQVTKSINNVTKSKILKIQTVNNDNYNFTESEQDTTANTECVSVINYKVLDNKNKLSVYSNIQGETQESCIRQCTNLNDNKDIQESSHGARQRQILNNQSDLTKCKTFKHRTVHEMENSDKTAVIKSQVFKNTNQDPSKGNTNNVGNNQTESKSTKDGQEMVHRMSDNIVFFKKSDNAKSDDVLDINEDKTQNRTTETSTCSESITISPISDIKDNNIQTHFALKYHDDGTIIEENMKYKQFTVSVSVESIDTDNEVLENYESNIYNTKTTSLNCNIEDSDMLKTSSEAVNSDSKFEKPKMNEELSVTIADSDVIHITNNENSTCRGDSCTNIKLNELEIENKNTIKEELPPFKKEENILERTKTIYKDDSGVVLKGIEYDDPEIGICYLFPLAPDSCNEQSDSDAINHNNEELIEVIKESRKVTNVSKSSHNASLGTSDKGNDDLVSETSFEIIVPKVTYLRRGVKRKMDMSSIISNQKKCKKMRHINCKKLSFAAIKRSAYKKEYETLFNYQSSVKFSYSIPFHKEYVDVPNIIKDWPMKDVQLKKISNEHKVDFSLFHDFEIDYSFKTYDPLKQTLSEEIEAKYKETEPFSTDSSENNFNMGFGEGSDRVIQNLRHGGHIEFSAATLSDVKQSQPLLKSEDCDNNENANNVFDDQIQKIKLHITYLQLRNKVRSFFKKTAFELKYDCLKEQAKKSYSKLDVTDFPFDLCSTEFIEPLPSESVVQVVQIGQLPVSAAAQNPVTCDPRVTQVSDASPSHCSVDNSPQDDSQPAIKTEYTELTTADLSLPLMQEYTQNQNITMESNANTNMQISDENIRIELEIKSEIKTEITEEDSEIKEESNNTVENNDLQSLSNSSTNNTEYPFETNNTSIESQSNVQMIFNSSEQQRETETFTQQKQQNGTAEKTDQLAHAMNAAGIATTAEAITDNRAHALVNLLSQKIRQGAINTSQSSTNNYTKTASINAMALQQALAQILPPPLNQTNTTENNQQTQNASVASQVLHIVQGKNSSGNQITLVDNSQQSVISTPNTQVLHIVQNKAGTTGPVTNGTAAPQSNSFSSLSLVDAGIQQGGNQLLHIVNTGTQKNNNTGQLLKRVNLLTNLANVQGSNEQKMVQFVCKSADGKAIQLNAPHQRSMVLRLQPIETPNAQTAPSKSTESQDLSPTLNTTNSVPVKESGQQEIKSRSVYEENYAKFIQNSSSKPAGLEKSTSLPKFNQAFGKPVFQDGSQKQNEINSNNLTPVNTENNECQSTDNAINLDHIGRISSPPLLLRKSPAQSSQSQTNLVQQIKQTIAPMNIQTMHGGVIYTRQIPVNIGGGQTINLITVPSTELIDDSVQKQQVNQNEIEPSIIKIVPQSQPAPSTEVTSDESSNHIGVNSENAQQNTQPQPVLTQMRIKLPMLSKTPQMVPGARVVRPSFFQIQRNVIGGTNQPVYQQLVLTAAPPLGQQTIRLPQSQQTTRPIKVTTEGQSSTESQMSSSTLEQLREFDMVLEQVKERSTVQPNSNSNNSFTKLHVSSDTTDSGVSVSSTSTEPTQQVLYSIGNNQSLNVAYVNRKATVTTPTTSTYVRSPDSSGISDSPTSSTHVQISHTITSDSSLNETQTQAKPAKVSSKSKSRPKSSSSASNSMKLNTVPPKTSAQKPLEDEQTTQRILYILAEYKEQVENSPDKDKPAPRRRSNPPTNPSGSSKRKKSSSGSRRPGVRDVSPIHGDDTCRTMGSEDSSCGTSQGDCTENCLESHSPQDSPHKVVRKLTFEQESPVSQPRPQPQRNVIVADGQTITVARGTAGKPTTAVLMPANYILPVSMVKGGQQIAIVTNRGPKLLTVGGGEGGTTNALLLQRLIGPAGLKPVLTRPGVRHVRLPAAALHNLQAFNLATATTVQPPDSTVSPAPAPTPPELIDTRATSSPWRDRDQDVKPERGSSPEGSEPWNLPSSADPHDYTYEETVRTDNMDRTVLDPIPDRYSPDMEAQRIFDKMFDVDSKKSYIIDSHDDSPRCGYDIDASDCEDKTYHQVVQKKDGSSHRQHRLTHVSAALRHKYAILEHELRLQKSLSEECEDLGVDSPSASELFPEAELLFAASPAHDHTQDQTHHSHTPQPTLLNQSGIPQPDIDDQIATDQLLPRENVDRQDQDLDVNLGLEDVGIVTVSEDGMQATIALDQEEFARSHPNTTFHSEPTDDGEEVQPFTISGLKGRHITSTIFHSNSAPATVLMTAPQTTVISQATAENSVVQNAVKYSDIDNMINSLPSTHGNDINLPSVLVKDDGLTRFDSILTDSRELHLSNTASAIVHSAGNATQVIRRVCYDDDKRERDSRFLMDEPDALIAGDDAKMIAEDSSRDATLESMAGDVDDDRSSPERHAELFWESNSASERSESRRPLDFSSDSDKCCKSPSYDETNSTDSSGVGAHMRLDSVIKEARGRERSGSADGSSADDTHPPLRTYPPKRLFHHSLDGELERSTSGKTRAGERSPDSLEGRRRASGRGVVKRGCHCCNGSPSPAPPRPKKSRQRKPNMDFSNN